MLGTKFVEALQLVSGRYREQTRKETPVTYVAHLMAVAGIVPKANACHPFGNIEDVAFGVLLRVARSGAVEGTL